MRVLVSQKQHQKQVDRARAKRQAGAAQGKQRRTRIIAIVLIAALALSLFALALAGSGPDTPEVTDSGLAAAEGDTDGTDGTDPAGTDDAAAAPDAGAASYQNPQPVEAEPCPTDVEAPEVTATPRDAAPEMTIDASATYVATVETTCGTIVVELATAAAPVTVNNFVTLAQEDYYVGVPFHRVINGFMIQGGDPTGTGSGNGGQFPGYTFEDELSRAEEVVAEAGGYPRGTLAMANAGPDTNGSQFFIVQGEPGYPLPPDYAVFGSVLEGMDVVDRIAQGPAQDQLAIDPVHILDVTIEQRDA
jgi:cyclophilin family peptidyl-prolyl cis-trans isomerase